MIRDLFNNSIAAYKTRTNKTDDPAYEEILPLNITFRKTGPIHKSWILCYIKKQEVSMEITAARYISLMIFAHFAAKSSYILKELSIWKIVCAH